MKIWKIIIICFLALLGYTSIKFFYYAAQGPDVSFQLDPNHQLMNWPGFLIQYNDKIGDYDLLIVHDSHLGESIPKKIDKFVISEEYIVAKAKEGWFVVDRDSLQAWGYYNSINDLENKIGKEFSHLDFVEEIPWEYLIRPNYFWVTMSIISAIFVGLILLIALWSRVVRMVKRTNS